MSHTNIQDLIKKIAKRYDLSYDINSKVFKIKLSNDEVKEIKSVEELMRVLEGCDVS